MSELLLRLAQTRFTALTQAETRLLLATQNGQVAICGNSTNDTDPTNNPGNCPNWAQERTVRSGVIEWLCSPLLQPNLANSKGVHIYAAKIVGALNFGHATIQSPLTFHLCAFENDISFKNARVQSLIFRGCRTKTIVADGVEVASNVLLTQGFQSRGELLFRDARVGGSFRTDGGYFEYAPGTDFETNSGTALGCDRMKVNGTIHLSTAARPSTFKGEVGLAGTFSGSNIECDGGQFENPGGFAIRADRLTAAGSIFLRSGFSANGVVQFPNSKMHALDCTGAKFQGDGETAINAEGAVVFGPVVFDHSDTTCGRIRFRGIDASDACFQLCKLSSLDLRHARIHREFRWKGVDNPGTTILDLRDATTETIQDEEASWPTYGNLYVDGLGYEGFTSSTTDVNDRLRWIRLDRSNPPQAYKQLASAYSASGETRNSYETLFHLEELLHDKQLDQLPFGPAKLIMVIWSQLLKLAIGYGYKLERAFAWIVLITILGFMASIIGYREKIIAPTDKDAFAYFMANGRAPDSYQRFSSFFYSVEHSIPAINLGISSNWSANSVAQSPGHPSYLYILRWWFWTQTLVGWGLSFFFIAGITGLVKSDK